MATLTPPAPAAGADAGGPARGGDGPGGDRDGGAGGRSAPVPGDLGPLGTLRWLWRRLTSMRTALVLLLLLALATIPGSLLPQRSVDAAAVAEFVADNPGVAPWLDRLGLFAVYSSPWFAAVYLLLFTSLVGCIVPRSVAHLREWSRRPPRAPARLGEVERIELEGTPEALAPRIAAALRPRWHTVVDVEGDVSDEAGGASGGGAGRAGGATRVVAARQGRLRETGNLVFHVSLLGVLVALAGSALYSWRGEVLVVEGEGFADTLPRYDSFTAGARFDTADLPPFALTLDDLDVRFESAQAGAFGAPRDFSALLTVTDRPGAPERVEVVRVNDPLDVGGARVYLSGNGYAPVVEVRDAAGEVTFRGDVPFLPQDGAYTSEGVVKVRGGGPGGEDLALEGLFLPTAAVDGAGARSVFPDAGNPRLILTASVGDLGLDAGRPLSVYSLDGADLEPLQDGDEPPAVLLAPGETGELPEGAGSVTFVELRRFAALDVRHDPTGPLALVSALLVLAGLAASLALPQRRAWVRLTLMAAATPATGADGAPRTVAEVAARSRPRDVGLAASAARIGAAVRAAAAREGREGT